MDPLDQTSAQDDLAGMASWLVYDASLLPAEDVVGTDFVSVDPALANITSGSVASDTLVEELLAQYPTVTPDSAGTVCGNTQLRGSISSFPTDDDTTALGFLEQRCPLAEGGASLCSAGCYSACASKFSGSSLKPVIRLEEFPQPHTVISNTGNNQQLLSPPSSRGRSRSSSNSSSSSSLSSRLGQLDLQNRLGDLLDVNDCIEVIPSSPTPSNASSSDSKRSCPSCGKNFSNTGNRNKHMASACKNDLNAPWRGKFWCRYCGHGSTTKSNNNVHQNKWCKKRPETLNYTWDFTPSDALWSQQQEYMWPT